MGVASDIEMGKEEMGKISWQTYHYIVFVYQSKDLSYFTLIINSGNNCGRDDVDELDC